MPTITSAGSGLWTAGATWVGGTAPADNDVVVIALTHVVEFDADLSGWANGIDGLTITGTLKLTRTTGVYYLKIKAAKTIAGAGTFDCGTNGDAIPFAAKHTITGGAGWYIYGAGGLSMTVYAAEPAIKSVLLTALEPAGETAIAVDASVIGEIWADGDIIAINDINNVKENELRVIAAGGIAAGTITITVGLTAAKSAGAYVILISRNLKIIGNAATVAQTFATGKLTIGGGEWCNSSASYNLFGCPLSIAGGTFRTANYGIFNVTGVNVTGGVFVNLTNAIGICSSVAVSGGIFSGNSVLFMSCFGLTISGGIFCGNNQTLYGCSGSSIVGGSFFGNANEIYQCAGVTILGGTFLNATNRFYASAINIKNVTLAGSSSQEFRYCVFTLFNVLITSAGTENSGYSTLSREIYSEAFDYNQVPRAFKAWTKGGVTLDVATPLPTGYSIAYKISLGNATAEGYWQREITVSAGASVNIDLWLRKDASMTYLPRCIIFSKAASDPFSGGVGIYTFTMTNSVDTWENEIYTYANNSGADVVLVIRFQGMNATGNVYTALTVDAINVDLTSALAALTAIQAKTDNLPSDPVGLTSLVEGTITLQQALRVILAEMAGKASGGGTATIIYRDPGDTKDRVIMTVDDKGNRSAVTLDVS